MDKKWIVQVKATPYVTLALIGLGIAWIKSWLEVILGIGAALLFGGALWYIASMLVFVFER